MVPGLVRKAVPSEALIASWRRVCDTTQVVTVRWPSNHSFYIQSGRYSPLLVTESIRQALALLSHTVHDIPLEHRLGWELLRSTVNPRSLHLVAAPVDVELSVTHTSITRRRLGSVHLSAQVEAVRAGEFLGRAELDFTTHPAVVYNRLRGPYANARESFARALPTTEPVPPARVGRSSEQDVVLTPTDTAHTWQLRLDAAHSVLFDHPHDHVPGMVLLEAVSQAVQAEAMPRSVLAVDFDTSFLRYVEFDAPCLISVERLDPDTTGRPRFKVEATQGGRLTLVSTVTAEPATAL